MGAAASADSNKQWTKRADWMRNQPRGACRSLGAWPFESVARPYWDSGSRAESTTKEMMMSNIHSTSDERITNNVMRHAYKILSEEEKASMQTIKDMGLSFHEYVRMMGPSRECSLAQTKIEEAVMWAVKHITK